MLGSLLRSWSSRPRWSPPECRWSTDRRLDQFQTDADEADALDYVDANFSSGSTDTTSAQIIVRDDNVLDKETLVSILEYERAPGTNETVNGTLVENDSTRSVANPSRPPRFRKTGPPNSRPANVN